MSLKQALNAGDCLSPRISRTDSSFGSYTVRSLSPLSVLPNTQNETLNYEGPLRLPGLSESHTIHRAGLHLAVHITHHGNNGISSKWQCSLHIGQNRLEGLAGSLSVVSASPWHHDSPICSAWRPVCQLVRTGVFGCRQCHWHWRGARFPSAVRGCRFPLSTFFFQTDCRLLFSPKYSGIVSL